MGLAVAGAAAEDFRSAVDPQAAAAHREDGNKSWQNSLIHIFRRLI